MDSWTQEEKQQIAVRYHVLTVFRHQQSEISEEEFNSRIKNGQEDFKVLWK